VNGIEEKKKIGFGWEMKMGKFGAIDCFIVRYIFDCLREINYKLVNSNAECFNHKLQIVQ
jgi:hypothetical protein